jgi:histone deacetylase 11
MNSLIVYSPLHDFRLPGVEWLHPFDGRKYSHAWTALEQRFGAALGQFHVDSQGEVSSEDLLAVHTADYIDSLGSSAVVARAVEVPAAGLVPWSLLDRAILRPMRIATHGTVAAVERALQGSTVFNLGGGYHHAFADHGEGFCIYADAAIAIARARRGELLRAADDIVVIDLDAHRGNGMEHIFGTILTSTSLTCTTSRSIPATPT